MEVLNLMVSRQWKSNKKPMHNFDPSMADYLRQNSLPSALTNHPLWLLLKQ